MTDERRVSEPEDEQRTEDEPPAEKVEDLEVASEESDSIKGGQARRGAKEERARFL